MFYITCGIYYFHMLESYGSKSCSIIHVANHGMIWTSAHFIFIMLAILCSGLKEMKPEAIFFKPVV